MLLYEDSDYRTSIVSPSKMVTFIIKTYHGSFLYSTHEYCLDNSFKYDILVTVKGDGCLNVENTRNCR